MPSQRPASAMPLLFASPRLTRLSPMAPKMMARMDPRPENGMINPPTRPTMPRTKAATPSPFLLPLAVYIPIPGGIGAEGVDAEGVGIEGGDPGGMDPGGGVAGV